MMYCENCRSYFEDDKAIKILKPASLKDEIKDVPTEELCPYCYNGFIEKAHKCDSCGAWVHSDMKICADCAEIAHHFYYHLRKEVLRIKAVEINKNVLSKGIKEYLIWHIENELFSEKERA